MISLIGSPIPYPSQRQVNIKVGIHNRRAYRPEKIGTVMKIRDKIKSVLPFCLILSRSEFQRSLQSFKTKNQYAI